MNWTDKIQVYNEDCLEAMKKMDDNQFDLAIVDPPYGIDVTKMNMGSRKTVKPDKSKTWDKGVPDSKYFKQLKRVSINQIIWGGNYFKDLTIFNPKLKRKFDFLKVYGVIWDKGETMYGRDFSECEIAYTTMHKGIYKMSPNQLDRIHPTQKPRQLYNWLLDNYAKEGDSILDTHLGSGSHAIACHERGFNLTAYEIDSDYFEAAYDRFKKVTSQLTIFDK